MTSWSFGALTNPDEAEVGAVPGLVDRGTSVDLVAFDTAAQARLSSREGLITLLSLRTNEALKYLRDGLTTDEKLVLAGHQKTSDEMLHALVRAGIRSVVEAELGAAETGWVADAAEFGSLETKVHAALTDMCASLLPHLMKALRSATELDKLVSKASSLAILSNLADVQAWRGSRITGASVAAMTGQMVRDLPRWVQAEVVRIDGMQNSPMRDKQLMDRISGSTDSVMKKVGNRFPELSKADWSTDCGLGAQRVAGRDHHARGAARQPLRELAGNGPPGVGEEDRKGPRTIVRLGGSGGEVAGEEPPYGEDGRSQEGRDGPPDAPFPRSPAGADEQEHEVADEA